MTQTPSNKAAQFREMHKPGEPFIIPNPWDAGSARMLEKLGYKALATTSSGFALTQGRKDYGVTRDEVIAHCEAIAAAVDIPVSADLENGFGSTPKDVGETIRRASQTGIAGGSMKTLPEIRQNLSLKKVTPLIASPPPLKQREQPTMGSF